MGMGFKSGGDHEKVHCCFVHSIGWPDWNRPGASFRDHDYRRARLRADRPSCDNKFRCYRRRGLRDNFLRHFIFIRHHRDFLGLFILLGRPNGLLQCRHRFLLLRQWPSHQQRDQDRGPSLFWVFGDRHYSCPTGRDLFELFFTDYLRGISDSLFSNSHSHQ